HHTYTCLKCWRSFSGGSSLIFHKRIHHGKRPIFCGRSFGQSKDLISHRRLHTGGGDSTLGQDRRKSFGRSSNLIRHQWIPAGERPYRCPNCGKGFTVTSKLIRHQQ
ncbi:ZNF16 protein, partial [Herpetotheres cachinnans]|nr:ZNF16 protein [Herpetotheres cachinnans]